MLKRIHRLLLTDPSFVTCKEDISGVLNKPNMAVQFNCTPTLMHSLKTKSGLRLTEDYAFGQRKEHSSYKYIGKHFTESGMTCLLDIETDFDDVDWIDFYLSRVDGLDEHDPDFPYLWFGNVETDFVHLFGIFNSENVYESILIKGIDSKE